MFGGSEKGCLTEFQQDDKSSLFRENKISNDFIPLTDMRASADYRLVSAKNMLRRYFAETQGAKTNVLEVSP